MPIGPVAVLRSDACGRMSPALVDLALGYLLKVVQIMASTTLLESQVWSEPLASAP